MGILQNLIKLKKLGASGIKQSLEDEGATFDDIRYMKRLSKKVNLGLDLQGGSYLLLEVDSQPVINRELQSKLISSLFSLDNSSLGLSSISF